MQLSKIKSLAMSRAPISWKKEHLKSDSDDEKRQNVSNPSELRAMLDDPPSGGTSAPQLAANYLRKEILAGRFPAGMRLKTEEVAETLGISRMPVRDALRQLHSEGLVVVRPNRGALVTRLTAKEVLEAFEIRAVLEGLAARCSCEGLTPHVLRQIEAVL